MFFKERDILLPNIQNDWNKGRASNDCEDQPGELELPNTLDKVFLGREQQYVDIVLLAQSEFRQPEQVVPPLVVTDISFVMVAALPLLARPPPRPRSLISLMLGNCGWEGCVIALVTNCAKSGWAMSEPVGVENQDDSMLSRPLRLDEIVETYRA